jgi:hypothetical protein
MYDLITSEKRKKKRSDNHYFGALLGWRETFVFRLVQQRKVNVSCCPQWATEHAGEYLILICYLICSTIWSCGKLQFGPVVLTSRKQLCTRSCSNKHTQAEQQVHHKGAKTVCDAKSGARGARKGRKSCVQFCAVDTVSLSFTSAYPQVS